MPNCKIVLREQNGRGVKISNGGAIYPPPICPHGKALNYLIVGTT
jgi:hypothetical protein